MLDALQFNSLAEFIDMGGYAFNVWSVYLLFVIFFVINLYHPLMRKKQIIREQKRRLLFEQQGQNRNAGSRVHKDKSTTLGEQS